MTQKNAAICGFVYFVPAWLQVQYSSTTWSGHPVMDTSVLTAYVRELTKKPFEDIYFFYLFMYQQTGFFFSIVGTGSRF